jgi:hypothetical protein
MMVGARIGMLVLFSLLVGCGIDSQYGVTDKKAEQELFFKCMEKVPPGPVATHYNDWSEVIEECGQQAQKMTWGCVKNCR